MPLSDTPICAPTKRQANPHPRRSVWLRLLMLLVVLAAIFLLPKIADLFTPLG